MQVETFRKVETTHFHKSPPRYSAAMRGGLAVESTGVGEDLRLNLAYVTTIPAIILMCEMVIGLICLISISPPRTWYSILYTFVIAIAFAVAVISFFCNLVTMKNVIFPHFNWYIPELIYTAVIAVLYLVTAIIHLILSTRQPDQYYLDLRGFLNGYIVAGAFGLVNSVVYCIGVYFLVKEEKREANTRIDNSG